MRIVFESKKLERLYTRSQGQNKFPPEVVKSFQKKIAFMEEASEQEIRSMRGLCYKKLKGSNFHSVRINNQFRLKFERRSDEEGTYLYLIDLLDYHDGGAK